MSLRTLDFLCLCRPNGASERSNGLSRHKLGTLVFTL